MIRTSAIILMLLFATVASGQTHQHGSMAVGEGNFNPFTISDNRGGFYVSYVERSKGEANVMLRHSADGKSFSAPVRVNDLQGDAAVRNENPPKVAASTNGDIYVCWANERARWKGDVKFARSTDGGKTFSRSITINSDAGQEPRGHAFQSISVDRKGRLYIAWIDERNKRADDRGAEIWMSTSDDGGKTFARDRKILSDVCECCRTNIQIDSAGRLFLSYRTVPPDGPMYRDIIVARSQDGGKTFSITRVSEDAWEINACPVSGPALCIDTLDRITVVWFTGNEQQPGLYYAMSADHGGSYSLRKPLDADQRMGKHAQAVARGDNNLLVVWDDWAQKTVSLWGILDPKTGLIQKGTARENISYPVAAVSNGIALVVGAQSATKDISFETAILKQATLETQRQKR
jgi:hypothetical protein